MTALAHRLGLADELRVVGDARRRDGVDERLGEFAVPAMGRALSIAWNSQFSAQRS